MKKFAKVGAPIIAFVSSLMFGAQAVYSQSSYYYSSSNENPAGFLFGSFLSIICWIFACLVSLVTLGFTILMIIDVTKRDETVLPKKTTWLILMAVGLFSGGWGFFVAVYYYFARKRKLDALKN